MNENQKRLIACGLLFTAAVLHFTIVDWTTNYRFVDGNGEEILIDAVTVTAALVGWMYVGPGGVMSGPPSTDFNQFLNRTGQ